MTDEEIRRTVVEALADVAPEVDAESLEPGAPLRDQVEVDSMDLLNFVIGIHERTGVDIPEADYPRLATLDACVAYLRGRLGDRAGGPAASPSRDAG